MVTKKVVHKIKIARDLLVDEGIIAVGIRGLEFIQKHTRKNGRSNKKSKIHTVARYEDVLKTELTDKPPVWNMGFAKRMSFVWIMPPPGKGSGGHLNIFRFINFLEKSGHDCKIYLFVDGKHGDIEGVLNVMGDSYPKIKAAYSMEWLDSIDSLPNVHGIFATSWETAYASYAIESNAKRFYFVQDFEPHFYPVGGLSTLAENTYKLGFYGITAGNWLKRKLATDYGMDTDSFDFGADEDIYELTNKSNRKEIFYYARPHTERRGFAVGILALDIFHSKHPEYIINLVGWDVSEYDIPFPYKNLKTLEIDELSTLYNRCAAGLVLSYTNMSLLPLELLRCGTIPVVNDGDNNRLVSNNKYIAYSNNDPHSLAAKLSEVVSRPDKNDYAQRASRSVKNTGWGSSGVKFVSIIEREMKR